MRMTSKALIRETEAGSVIAVEVTPSASRSGVFGINEWRRALRISVVAAAKNGAANDELVRFLSEQLGVPKAELRIVRGHKSALKSVFVPLSSEETLRRLGVR